jgi:hypothetical protein
MVLQDQFKNRCCANAHTVLLLCCNMKQGSMQEIHILIPAFPIPSHPLEEKMYKRQRLAILITYHLRTGASSSKNLSLNRTFFLIYMCMELTSSQFPDLVGCLVIRIPHQLEYLHGHLFILHHYLAQFLRGPETRVTTHYQVSEIRSHEPARR